jgi:putative endonuclease
MSEILSLISEVKTSELDFRNKIGSRGEALSADFLAANGFRLVAANFKVPVGRNSKGVQVTGEIDLIALDGNTLCFVEVKTRRSEEFTPVITNVDIRKQRQITRTAKVYRKIFGIRDMPVRFDVVTVLMPKYAEPEIKLTKGYWNESKFQKKNWNHRIWNDFL